MSLLSNWDVVSARDELQLRLLPRLLDQVWRHYATTSSGQQATALPVRGVTRATGVELERRVALEATR